ncbi:MULTISPECIES: DUF4244 domain-containing protein [Amycolatopsis]|uniref:Membrane protein n=2 Tax=Amycolatopsis methanolica group TaxID=2893674 RepID=A0A076N5X2_AMYME|nr:MULTISPECIES: DUF4244 domain-containing protein [Amycolatopsis methanolica group]AIJ26696.1 membrane protein [Amycolatopsis methanolica 239]ROS41586.1 uncharacterized protein DUF4244 [Amycolatopsis thermoflava]
MLFRTKPAGRHAAPARPRWWRRWLRPVLAADDGMSTAEYAIGTIAAAAFGALLYTVVTGDSVVGALTGLVEQALTVQF